MKSMRFVLPLILLCLSDNAECQLWKQYADSGLIYKGQNNLEQAIEYLGKAKNNIGKDSANSRSMAIILEDIATIYTLQKQYDKAEELFLESNKIWGLGVKSKSLEYANSCYNVGFFYISIGQYKKAEPLLIQTKQIKEELLGPESSDFIQTTKELGNLFMRLGLYEKAIMSYQIVKEYMNKRESKDTNYAAICTDLARACDYGGKVKIAEELYQEAINLYSKKDHGYFKTCSYMGDMYCFLKRYKEAEPLLFEAINGIEINFGRKSIEYASVALAIADLYRDMGNFSKAEIYYIEAKEIREKVYTKNHPDYAASCNALAVLYEKLGQYKKSESLFLEARFIREKTLGKNNSRYAASCYSLGILYGMMGETEKALPFAIEAKQIREEIHTKNHPDYLYASNILARIYIDLRDYEKAVIVCEDAMNFIKLPDVKNQPLYEHCCNVLASLYNGMEQFVKAEMYYKEVLNYRERIKGELHAENVATCINLGSLYWRIKENEKAIFYFEKASSIQYFNINKVFEFTSEQEKNSYISGVSILNKIIYSFSRSILSYANHGFIYDASLLYRNLILSSSQQLRNSILKSGNSDLIFRYNKWMDLREDLSQWYSIPISKRPDNLKKLEEDEEKLEKALARESSNFSTNQKKAIDWKNIKETLLPGEAAIEFVEFQYYDGIEDTDSIFYMALVLKKDNPRPELVQLFEKKQLDSILNYKSTSAGAARLNLLYRNQEDEMISSLYNIIWKPIEQKLTGINTVYFTPAGELFKISFAALPINSKNVLSDKYQLIQLNTTGSINANLSTTITASDKIILYGGILYDVDSTSIRKAAVKYSTNDVASRSLPEELLRDGVADWIYLSGTEKEIKGISLIATEKNYNVSVSEGVEATEESFKELAGKNSPVVLHIASHGFFFPDPKDLKKNEIIGGATVFRQSDNPLLRSGLTFAGINNAWKGKPIAGVLDGILTSYEISNMYMPNTKLVVLSACETGLGDIQGSEGVYGLQRAFKMAGVENLIMSLWKVDDAATAEFMQEFYKNLFLNQTIQNAFDNSQSVIKNKYRSDPHKWAAWVLIR